MTALLSAEISFRNVATVNGIVRDATVLQGTQLIYWPRGREHGGRNSWKKEFNRLPQAVLRKQYIRQLKFSQGLSQHVNQNHSKSSRRSLCPLDHLHHSPFYSVHLRDSLNDSLRDNRIDRLSHSPSDNTNSNLSDGLNDQLSLTLYE